MNCSLACLAARLSVLSNLAMWTSAAFAMNDIAAFEAGTSEEGIYISLPVYIVSLIATAGFTWTVSKYDAARLQRMNEIESKLDRLLQSDEDSV
jgi:hypothetical protein